MDTRNNAADIADAKPARDALRVGMNAVAALAAGGALLNSLSGNPASAATNLIGTTKMQNMTGAVDMPPGGAARTLHADGAVTAVAWDKGGSLITASDFGRTVSLWNAQGTSELIVRREASFLGNSLHVLGGGQLLMASAVSGAGEADFALSIIDIAGKRTAANLVGPQPGKPAQFNRATAFAVSPDGGRIAAITSPLPGGSVSVFGTEAGVWRVTASLPMPRSDSARSVAFAPDGGRVAVGSAKGKIFLYDLAAPEQPVAMLSAYEAAPMTSVDALAFSPDGKLLACGAGLIIGAGTSEAAQKAAPAPVKVWRLADLALVFAHPGDFAPVRALDWGFGGVLAAAGGDRTLRLFGGANAAEPIRFGEPVMAARFSPDGRRLAVASGNTVRLLPISN